MTVPNITVTAAAAEALTRFHQPDEPHTLRIELMADGSHGLAFDERAEADMSLKLDTLGQFEMIMAPETAERADGLVIDFVDNGEHQGFRFDRPTESEPTMTDAEKAAVIASLGATSTPQIQLSSRAYQMFVEAIEGEGGPADYGILVRARRMGGTNCNYELDVMALSTMTEDVFRVEQDGFVMWCDKISARYLNEITIDFVEEDGRAGFRFESEALQNGWQDARATKLEALIESEINPGLAAHGGYVRLLELIEHTAFVVMGGGCQGCGMAAVTLQQGVKQRVREALPSIEHIIDTTDHAAGLNPYYQKA